VVAFNAMPVVKEARASADPRQRVLDNLYPTNESTPPGFNEQDLLGLPRLKPTSWASCLAGIERLPETREFYEKLGAETMQGGADEIRQFRAAEIERWKRIAVKAKIDLETVRPRR
jgi:hypothetical protein